MSTDPHEKKPSEKIVKPAPPHEHPEPDTHAHPELGRYEEEKDHHEHGNLPKRPGRPGTT